MGGCMHDWLGRRMGDGLGGRLDRRVDESVRRLKNKRLWSKRFLPN